MLILFQEILSLPRKAGQPRREYRLPGLSARNIFQGTINTVRCLKCQEPFPSVDPKINRICQDCTDSNSRLSKREITQPISLPPGTVIPLDGQEFY